MTFNERAEYERREAIRVARYEAFCARALEAQRAAEEESRRLLAAALCKKVRQKELEFSI